MASIHFFQEDVSFRLLHQRKLRSWIIECVSHYTKVVGDLNYIFCSDAYLLEMNKEHLQHDYETDIITFDYSDNETVSGDLFISLDRVIDNAKTLKVKRQDELHRVMIHGVLHLAGFKDKNPQDQAEMRSQEDYCLSLRTF